MRVAVFRAATDGQRTAARLAALGHEAVLAPVIRIEPTGTSVQAGDADGIVLTSAHAVEALSRTPDGSTALHELPCWCVGAHTAEAARMAGFALVRTGTGTASRLAATLAGGFRGRHLLYVAGRDRKPDLERALADAGLRVAVVEAYAAEAVPRWTGAEVDALAGVAVALHYSRRTADLARRLADAAKLGPMFREWTHGCLSADVAAGLDRAGVRRCRVADRPDESSLMAILASEPGPAQA